MDFYESEYIRLNERYNALAAEAIAADRKMRELEEFVKRVTTDAKRDYDFMREFQAKFIAADRRARKFEEALIDYRNQGLRFDLNPTLDFNISQTDMLAWWHQYIRSMDASVRERAENALHPTT